MKTFKQSLCIFLCTATIIFSSLSCSPKLYLDAKGSSMKIDEGYLASYVDSNVFVYKTKAFARMDMERLYPRFFEVKLPRNIQYFVSLVRTVLNFTMIKSRSFISKLICTIREKIISIRLISWLCRKAMS